MGHFFEGVLLEKNEVAEALLPIRSGKPFETQDIIERLIAMGKDEAQAARAAKGLLLREDRAHRIALGLDGWSAAAERHFGLPGRLGFLIRIENEIVDHGASIDLDHMLARAFLPTSKREFPAFTTSGDPSLMKELVQQILPHWFATPHKVDDLHWIELEGYLYALPFRNKRKGPARSTPEYKGTPDWLTPSMPLAYAHALVLAAIQHERYDLHKIRSEFEGSDQYATADFLRAKPERQMLPISAEASAGIQLMARPPEFRHRAEIDMSGKATGQAELQLSDIAQDLASVEEETSAEVAHVGNDSLQRRAPHGPAANALEPSARHNTDRTLSFDDGRRFITFEGGEGTGKSTQAEALCAALSLGPKNAILTREPGGTELAEAVRSRILEKHYAPMGTAAEALAFSFARLEHMTAKILPALAKGDWVVCDRFYDSTRAYQGAAGNVDQGFLDMLDNAATAGRTPDLTIILDLPAEISLARAAARRGDATPDRFEGEALEFHQRLRAGFLEIAALNPGRCHVIDCEGLDPLQVQQRVVQAVKSRLMGCARN